jgi:hypothetical protein
VRRKFGNFSQHLRASIYLCPSLSTLFEAYEYKIYSPASIKEKLYKTVNQKS